jgi:SNF2 family DNA or RNA helicase
MATKHPKTCVGYARLRGAFVPQDHQQWTLNYLLRSQYRGICLYHKLGSGKTCTAIDYVDTLNKILKDVGAIDDDLHVYVFTPGSLRQNFISEYCGFCGENREIFEKKFHFFSYNYSKIAGKLPTSLIPGSIIIVDESQNLINGYRNRSSNYVAVYDHIKSARNARVLLLSGIPLNYYPYELALMLDLIKPGYLTTDPDDFAAWYIDVNHDGDLVIHDINSVIHALKGVISYVDIQDPSKFPQRIDHEPYLIPMTPYQIPLYLTRRDIELEQLQPLTERLRQRNPILYRIIHQKKFLAYAMIKSRQICNMAYPEKMQKQLDKPREKRKEMPPDKLKEDGGWLTFKQMELFREKYSPKLLNIVQNVLKFEGKQLVHSFYLDRYGTKILVAMLKECGIKALTFTGELTDKKRQETLDKFNSQDNIFGKNYKVIIVTVAGSLGITLLEVRDVHIVDPDISEASTEQVIGRAIRLNSHIRLSEDERTVTVHRYLSTVGDELSADQLTAQRALRRWKSINQILDIMKRSSVDCRKPWSLRVGCT